MSTTAAQDSPMRAKLADGQGTDDRTAPADTSTGRAGNGSEHDQQILALLEQGDRDIAAGNGHDWEEVKQRMRDRIAAIARPRFSR